MAPPGQGHVWLVQLFGLGINWTAAVDHLRDVRTFGRRTEQPGIASQTGIGLAVDV